MFEAGLPLCKVERRHIRRTLHTVRGSRSEAARLLQISVRCLQYKLKAYGQQSLRAERANFSNLERRSARKVPTKQAVETLAPFVLNDHQR